MQVAPTRKVIPPWIFRKKSDSELTRPTSAPSCPDDFGRRKDVEQWRARAGDESATRRKTYLFGLPRHGQL